VLRFGSSDDYLSQENEFWDRVQTRYLSQTGLLCTVRKGTSGGMKYHGVVSRPFSTTSARSDDTRRKPRVLMVNHGYPPQFNGGSEVYAQTLALQLLESGNCSDVQVMAREHDPFRPDFEFRHTCDDSNNKLPVHLLNYSREAPYFRFQGTPTDDSFRHLLQRLQPDIVHFHHLKHLSLNLPVIAK
jgi:hypothetical protein